MLHPYSAHAQLVFEDDESATDRQRYEPTASPTEQTLKQIGSIWVWKINRPIVSGEKDN